MREKTPPVPAYLQPPENPPRTYGDLTFDEKEGRYIVDGEPMVLEMARRLFPGSSWRNRGPVAFKATTRLVGDLTWLLQRYPLKIQCREQYEKDRQAAVRHAQRRESNLHPKPVTSLPGEFLGELKEFQKEGVAFLLANPRSLLADEQGLGKTIQGLAAGVARGEYPILVVVPRPKLARQWRGKIGEWLDVQEVPHKRRAKRRGQADIAAFVGDLQPSVPSDPVAAAEFRAERMVHIVEGIKPYELPNKPFILLHYGQLAAWKEALLELAPRTVIFDEVQELRHKGTQKYSAASAVSMQANSAWGLSGTPIYNKGIEIHSVLNILDYHCLGDEDSFTKEWCSGYGSDTVEDPDLLGQYLREEGLILRRTFDDPAVGINLPPMRHVVQVIGRDEGTFQAMMEQCIALAHGYEDVKSWHLKGQIGRYIENEARRAIGEAKAPFVAEFVRGLVQAGERVLLAAHHHTVHEKLVQLLADCNAVKITGKETEAQKDEAQRKFQDGEAQVIILALRSVAGLDGLQGMGTVVVNAELDWSPGVHSQLAARLRRMGFNKAREFLMTWYLVGGGIDETIQEALGIKVGQFVGIVGDKKHTAEHDVLAQQAAESHLVSVIEALKKNPRPKDVFAPVECSWCRTAIFLKSMLGGYDKDNKPECTDCHRPVVVAPLLREKGV